MRKTNTFKKIFIITALVLSLGLATFGVSRIKRADAALITDASGASGNYVTYTYEVYDYDDYIQWSNWATDLDNYLAYAVYTQGRGSNMRYYLDIAYGNEVWDGTDGGGDVINATNDPLQTAYAYYGGYPEDLLGTATINDRTGEVTWAGPNTAKPTPLEKVEQGQKIVVAVFAEASGGQLLNGAGVSMSADLHGAATLSMVGSPAAPEAFSYTEQASWSTSYVGVSTSENDSYTGTNGVAVVKLGGQDGGSTSTGYSGKQFLGALAYEIKSNFSSTLDLSPIGGGGTFFVLQGGSGYTAAQAVNHTHFVINAPSYTVEGVDNTDGKLKSITINTGSNPYTVDNTGGPISTSLSVPSANQPAATKTTVTVSAAVNSVGCTYVISYGPSSSGPWTTTASSVTLEDPGSKTYIKIYTTSQDGTGHETYIIEVPRKKYEDAVLTSVGTLTAVTTESGVAPTLSPSFASSTKAYQVKYASDTSSITFTPQFDSVAVSSGGKGMTGFILHPGSAAETPITSGTPVTVSAISDNATFTVRIKAQDTSKYTDYVFTLKELSSDNSLVVSVAVGSTNKPGAFSTAAGHETEWSLNNPLLYGENYATVTLSNPKGATIVATLGGATQSNPANINFGTGVAASTKTLNVAVTSQAGSTKNYTIELTRGAANSHKELDMTATKVYYNPTAGGAPVEVPGSWDTTTQTWTASADVPFTAGSFYIVPVLDGACLQDSTQPFHATNNPFVATMKLNGSSSVASGANSATTSFSGYALDSKTATIVVKAQDDISGTNTNTYTFKINRAAANTDSALKAGELPLVVTTDPDSSNVTLDAFNSTTREWSNTSAIDAKYKKASVSNLVANASTSKVEVSTDSSSWTAFSGSYLLTLNRSNTPTYTTLYVRVTAENPSYKTLYTIKVNSQALQTGTDFTATLTSTGDMQTVGQKSTSTPTTHYYDIAKINGSATNTQFTIKIDLNASTSDRAKIYWGTSATSQTTEITTGSTIPAQNIGAFGSPTLIFVKIVSEYGTPEVHTYSVQHTDTRDTNNKIANIQVITKDYKGNTYTNTYSFNQADTTKQVLNLPYTVTSIQFVVKLEKTTSTLIYNSGAPKNPDTSGGDTVTITPPNIGGSIAGNVPTNQTFSFQGRSEATTTATEIYEIEVKRDTPETGQVITSLVVNGGSYNPVAGNKFPIGISSASANVTVNVSPKADFVFEYGSSSFDANPIMMNNEIPSGTYKNVKIKVYSEKVKVDGGSPTIYDVYLVNASQLTDIDDIELLEYKNSAVGNDLPALDGSQFNYSPGIYNYSGNTVKIAYATGEPYFQVNIKSSNPNVWITGDTGLQTHAVGTKTYKITVNSEYNKILDGLGIPLDSSQTDEYKIKIERVAASTEAELLWAKIDYVDGNGVAQQVTVNLLNPQNIENVGHISNAVLSFEKKDEKALLISPTVNNNDRRGVAQGSFNIPLNFSSDGQKVAVQLICQAEDGMNSKTYNTFWIASTQAILDTDASLNKLRGYGDVTTADQLTYPAGAPTFNVTIPGANTKFYVDAIPTKPGASVFIDAGDGNLVEYTGSGAKEITLGAPGTTVNIRVQCHAQDPSAPLGTMYYINVTRDNLDQDATLKNFKAELYDSTMNLVKTVQAIPGWTTGDNGGNYTLNVTNDIAYVKLLPTLNSSKSTVTNNDAQNAQILAVGSNGPFIVTVTAEDTTKVNNFNVTVVRDDEVEALNIVLVDTKNNAIALTPVFASNGNVFNGTVAYTEDKTTITVTPKGNIANLTITGDGQQPLNEGSNSLVITIKAASGASKSYTFNITRSNGNSDNYFESFTDALIEGTNKVPGNYARLANSFEYNLPRNTTVWTPTFTLSTGATSNFDSLDKSLVPGKNVKVVTITSEKGAPRDVTIEIYCTQTTKELASLSLLETAGGSAIADKNNGNVIQLTPTEVLTIDVPFGTSSIMSGYIKAVLAATSDQGAIFIDSAKTDAQAVQIAQGVNTYVVTVLSEDDLAHGKNQTTAPEKQYIITVNRQPADSDAHLATLKLEVYKDGAWVEIPFEAPGFTATDNGGSYFIANLDTANYGTTTSYKVSATSVKSTTKINSTSTGTFTESGSFVSDVATNTGFLKEISIVTLAEDASSTFTYKITLSRGPLDLNGDNTIGSISLVDSTGKSYISSNSAVQPTYEFNVPYSANSLTFSVAKGSSWSPSTITYKKGTVVAKQSTTDLVYTDSITTTMRGTTVVYTIQATAQNGNPGTAHTVTIHFLEPSKDAYLTMLMADSEVVTGFNPADQTKDNYTYTLANRPFEKQNIVLSATGPALATISGLGSRPLREGLNSFDVYVTSESGDTVTYTILVTREEQDPYLTNLQVSGKQLLDSSFAATTFNKAIKSYYAKVSYYDDEVTLVTNVDNATYTVTSSNGSVETVNGNSKTFKTSQLTVGYNYVTITVYSQGGKYTDYNLVIYKQDQQSATAAVTNISVRGYGNSREEELPAGMFVYEDGKTTYNDIEVENRITELHLNVQTEYPGETVQILNNTNLKVGENKVYAVVTAEDGVSKRVIEFNVNRKAPNYIVDIDKVSQFKTDYAAKTIRSQYEVESKDFEANIEVLADANTAQGFTYTPHKVALVPGENTFKLIITDPSGSQEETEVTIFRKHMSFGVNTSAYAYNCQMASQNRDTDPEWYYTIDMNGDSVTKINNFAQYITNLSDGCTVQVMTNTSYDSVNEVLLRVSNIDETEVKYVHFKINNAPQSTNNNGALNNVILWVMIGILALLLLLIIFILIYVRVILVVMNNRRRRDDED